jgi:hypothetical protein
MKLPRFASCRVKAFQQKAAAENLAPLSLILSPQLRGENGHEVPREGFKNDCAIFDSHYKT